MLEKEIRQCETCDNDTTRGDDDYFVCDNCRYQRGMAKKRSQKIK